MTDQEARNTSENSVSTVAFISAGVSFFVVMFGTWVVIAFSAFFVNEWVAPVPQWGLNLIGYGGTGLSIVLGLLSARRAYVLSTRKTRQPGTPDPQLKRWYERPGIVQTLVTVGGFGLGAVIGYFSIHDHSFGAILGAFFGFLVGFFGSSLYFTMTQKN